MGDRTLGGDSGRLRKEEIRRLLKRAGAAAAGFAKAGRVDESVERLYRDWTESGYHAGMHYMESNMDLRMDPRMLLAGAHTVISTAWCYRLPSDVQPAEPGIARYALLDDYHDWIRRRIRRSGIGEILGTEHTDWRICVDSAPIVERWWAVKAGTGVRGANGMVIVPGAGSEVFLAEILTLAEFEVDRPLIGDCGNCGECMKACPTGALQPDGTIDADLCLSYLTIEHRGPAVNERQRRALETAAAKQTLFGCDRCVAACPHNKRSTLFTDEPAHQGVGALRRADLQGMSREEFSARLKGSPLKRARARLLGEDDQELILL